MTTRRTRSKNIHTDLVRELRQRRSDGYGVLELAEHFGLSASSVSNVTLYRTHKDVLDLDNPPALPPLQTRFKRRTPQPALDRIPSPPVREVQPRPRPVYRCAEGHRLQSGGKECVVCVREAAEATEAKAKADAEAKYKADAKAKADAAAKAEAKAEAKAKEMARISRWSGHDTCDQGHVVVQRTPDGGCATCALLAS